MKKKLGILIFTVLIIFIIIPFFNKTSLNSIRAVTKISGAIFDSDYLYLVGDGNESDSILYKLDAKNFNLLKKINLSKLNNLSKIDSEAITIQKEKLLIANEENNSIIYLDKSNFTVLSIENINQKTKLNKGIEGLAVNSKNELYIGMQKGIVLKKIKNNNFKNLNLRNKTSENFSKIKIRDLQYYGEYLYLLIQIKKRRLYCTAKEENSELIINKCHDLKHKKKFEAMTINHEKNIYFFIDNDDKSDETNYLNFAL